MPLVSLAIRLWCAKFWEMALNCNISREHKHLQSSSARDKLDAIQPHFSTTYLEQTSREAGVTISLAAESKSYNFNRREIITFTVWSLPFDREHTFRRWVCLNSSWIAWNAWISSKINLWNMRAVWNCAHRISWAAFSIRHSKLLGWYIALSANSIQTVEYSAYMRSFSIHIERNAFESWCYSELHTLNSHEWTAHGKLPRFNYLINDCNNIVGVATIITWPLVDCNRRIVGRRMNSEEMTPNWWKSAKFDSSRMCWSILL